MMPSRYRWQTISAILSRQEHLEQALTRDGLENVNLTGRARLQDIQGITPDMVRSLESIGILTPEDILDEFKRGNYQGLMDIQIQGIDDNTSAGVNRKRELLAKAIISALGSDYTMDDVNGILSGIRPTERAGAVYPWQEQRIQEISDLFRIFRFGDGKMRNIHIYSSSSGLTKDEMEQLSRAIPASPTRRNIYYGLSVIGPMEQREFLKKKIETSVYKIEEGIEINKLLEKDTELAEIMRDLGLDVMDIKDIAGENPNLKIVGDKIVPKLDAKAIRQLEPEFTELGTTSSPNILRNVFIPDRPNVRLEDHRGEVVIDNFKVRRSERNAVFSGVIPVKDELDLRNAANLLETNLKFGFVPRGMIQKDGVDVGSQLGKMIISIYPDFDIANTFFKADSVSRQNDYFIFDISSQDFNIDIDRLGVFVHKSFFNPTFRDVSNPNKVKEYVENHEFIDRICIQNAEDNYVPYRYIKQYLEDLREAIAKRPSNRVLYTEKTRTFEGTPRGGLSTIERLMKKYDDALNEITSMTNDALGIAQGIWESDLVKNKYYYKRGGCSVAVPIEIDRNRNFAKIKIHTSSPAGERIQKVFDRCTDLHGGNEPQVAECVKNALIFQQNVSKWLSNKLYNINKIRVPNELRADMEEIFDATLKNRKPEIKNPQQVKKQVVDYLATEGKTPLTLKRFEFLDRYPAIARPKPVIVSNRMCRVG